MNAVRKQQGVNSIEIGLRLVRVLAEAGAAMTLKDLAAAAQMPAAKAHRYMVSLIRAGLVEQHKLSGRYDLGPLALTTGLAALGRLDHQRLAWEKLVELREAVGETVAIGVWNGRGAVITRWEDSPRPVTVNVRVGSVLSPVFSASGRAIVAFLPRAAVEPLVAAEFALGTPTYMGKPLAAESVLRAARRYPPAPPGARPGRPGARHLRLRGAGPRPRGQAAHEPCRDRLARRFRPVVERAQRPRPRRRRPRLVRAALATLARPHPARRARHPLLKERVTRSPLSFRRGRGPREAREGEAIATGKTVVGITWKSLLRS